MRKIIITLTVSTSMLLASCSEEESTIEQNKEVQIATTEQDSTSEIEMYLDSPENIEVRKLSQEGPSHGVSDGITKDDQYPVVINDYLAYLEDLKDLSDNKEFKAYVSEIESIFNEAKKVDKDDKKQSIAKGENKIEELRVLALD